MSGPDDRDGEGLHRLLSDLADDPGAPPSSVSGLSVIAAARGGVVPAAPTGPTTAVARTGPMGSTGPVLAADGGTGAAAHLQSLQDDADRRARRRRTALFGGLAAACAVAVAAIVIPIAVSSSSSTTSAGSAADQVSAPAGAAAESATGAEPDRGEAGPTDQEGGAAAAPSIDPSNPDANRPPPGESALSQVLPVPGATTATVAPDGSGAAGTGAVASCWPPLSDQASAALVAALPAGAFGAPEPLGLGCPADPVGGAQLAGSAPDSQLVVRVTRADPGACAAAASETGARCVAKGGDQYVADEGGALSVYAYGNGYQVEVGGRPATGIAPIPSGLDADQLSAAAAAVLGAQG